MKLQDRVARSLVVTDKDGSLLPPGAGPILRVVEPDGSEFAVIARGDGFDVYFGRDVITNFSLTTRTALQLGVWIVHWWVRYAWCGLKLRLWWWAISPRAPKKARA